MNGWIKAGNTLEKTFTFDSFPEAIGFVNKVAEAAEAAKHHPDIVISYKTVTLRLSSHDVGKVTDRDTRLAQAIDAL